VDACPEEAIVMSREHHQTAADRSETIYSIEKLMERPGIDSNGIGYRPNTPFLEASLYSRSKQTCDIPSDAEERHPSVLYESMFRRRS
jgi:formate hydrogenlyase subunit 6/NADH:ubiquinone oxidoreductase subunit I